MNATVHDALDYLLGAAYINLAQARQELAAKDTPAHRGQVAAALRRIDELLDHYNTVKD